MSWRRVARLSLDVRADIAADYPDEPTITVWSYYVDGESLGTVADITGRNEALASPYDGPSKFFCGSKASTRAKRWIEGEGGE